MTTASLTMQLSLNVPSRYAVVSCRLAEGISERTHAEIEIASHDFIDFERVLGDDVTIALEGVDSRSWRLKLGRAAFVAHVDSSLRFRLDLYDAAWLLGFSKNTRKFRNMSAREVVGRVLGEGHVSHRFQIADPPLRKYCSQYRETNLAFVERLLEFEGIYYTFDPDGGMVLGDCSDASPMVREAPFELIEAAGALAHGEVGIHALKKGRRVRSGQVTVGDHNWKKPKLVLRESSSADRDTHLGRFEYPAGYRLPDQGARLAGMRLEAERAQASFIEGRGNVPAFAPGSGFSVGAQGGDRFAGRYLLVRVEHRFDNGELRSASGRANGPGQTHYENRFTGMPLAARFRPALRTPRPRAGGTHTAMVRGPDGQAIHTDEHGRFCAQFHWDREGTGTDADSRWIRPLQESATSMTLARTGWEVFVGYIDGDPDRPVGLGRAINGVAVPTYALPGNKNMMAIRTPSVGGGGGAFNEIKMDDSAGSQAISVRAERDFDALVKNEKTEKIGRNETHFVGTCFSRQVAEDQEVAIGADATASYGENHRVSIAGSRTKKVGGSEDVKIGKNAQTRTGGDETEKVGSLRLTVAGAIRLPDSRTLAQMATGLGMGYLRNLAPGLAAAADSAQSIAGKVEALQHTGADPVVFGLQSAAQAGTGAAVATFLGGTEQGGARGALAAAAGGAASAAVGGEGDHWIGSTALQSGGQAILTNPESSPQDGVPTQGSLDAASQAFAQSFGNTIDRVLPTQQELAALVPSESWVPNEQTFNQANAALVSQLKQMISIEGVTNLLCSGGIARNATSAMHKLVGGAYITAALLGIDTRVGAGYVETVGGLKLTLAAAAIREEVSGKLYVTVGGAIRRHSICYLVISSGTNSTVSVGALASYEAGQRFDVLGDVIKVSTTSALTMKGGGAEVAFDSSSVKLKGKMKLTAGKSITLVGGSKLDVTK